MSAELYQVLSLGMRYWFTFLGVLIVLRVFIWLRKDRKARHRRLRSLPDAGLVGELVVLSGSDELPEETAIPLPYEGVLGYVRGCDVTIPCEGVQKQHLDFSFQPNVGLMIYPRHGLTCLIDGEEVTSRAHKIPLYHGSILEVGSAKLRVRLFAGLDVGGHSRYTQDAPISPLPNETFASTADLPIYRDPTAWQQMNRQPQNPIQAVPPQGAYPQYGNTQPIPPYGQDPRYGNPQSAATWGQNPDYGSTQPVQPIRQPSPDPRSGRTVGWANGPYSQPVQMYGPNGMPVDAGQQSGMNPQGDPYAQPYPPQNAQAYQQPYPPQNGQPYQQPCPPQNGQVYQQPYPPQYRQQPSWSPEANTPQRGSMNPPQQNADNREAFAPAVARRRRRRRDDDEEA